jgi:hypothetical protein
VDFVHDVSSGIDVVKPRIWGCEPADAGGETMKQMGEIIAEIFKILSPICSVKGSVG